MKLLAIVLLALPCWGQTAKPQAADNIQDIHVKSVGISIGPTGNYAEITGTDNSRVVHISAEEYAELQKLRQAVADKEKEIARAHGVYFAPPPCDPSTMNCWIAFSCDRVGGCPPKPTDEYQFRGQFLLINVPAPK